MSIALGAAANPQCDEGLFVFVVVIFGVDPDHSQTVTSLRECLRDFPVNLYRVLVIDNSTGQSPAEYDLASNIYHVVAGENGGLAKAYNYALTRARVWRANFFVTFDQDSVVTSEYIRQLFNAAPALAGNFVAMCPGIRSAGRIVSPFGFSAFGWPRYGNVTHPLYAINSFSAYSVEYLCSVGGFDEYYWLDALDFSIFARIARQGLRVMRLETVVDHDLSLLSGSVSSWRLVNISYYEASFLMEYATALHLFGGWIRLVARALRVRRYGMGFGTGVAMLVAAGRGALAGLKRRGRKSDK